MLRVIFSGWEDRVDSKAGGATQADVYGITMTSELQRLKPASTHRPAHERMHHDADRRAILDEWRCVSTRPSRKGE